MEFKRGEICYILESNCTVKQAKIVSRQGKFYTIQLIGSCGAIRLPGYRLFSTEESAAKSKKESKPMVNVHLSEDLMSSRKSEHNAIQIDVFEGKRVNRNPHIH